MNDVKSFYLLDVLYDRVIANMGLLKLLEKRKISSDIIEDPEALFLYIRDKAPDSVKKDRIMDVLSSFINLRQNLEDL
jgi:dimeric dUTPase (all-alpha-NTP-PPase superfamily)